MPRVRSADAIAACFCLLFLLVGSLWIWRPGLQEDEALFSAGIYPPFFRSYCVRACGHEFPLMVMTYVGTLKATLYRVFVFPFFDPSAASIRVPALILGATSIWLFYQLCRRIVGWRAALAAAALLATDTVYLLTIRLDWGPVALQHLCLIGGLLALVCYWQERRLGFLGLGFFIFGLALWDKALFAWSLTGLVVASMVTFRRALRDFFRPRHAAVAFIAFGLGTLPFLIFNVRHDWVTFRSNAKLSTDILGYKAKVLWSTINGSALFGYFVREDWDQPEGSPAPVSRWTPRTNLTGYLLLFSLILLPFSGKNRRAALFALVFAAVLWLQMALSKDGGSVHHAVLLCPAICLLIAAVLARLPSRTLAVIITILCIANIAVTSTYYSMLIRNGGGIVWTEAIWPALDQIKILNPIEVSVLDWGFFDSIRLMHKGQTKVGLSPVPNNESERSFFLKKLQKNEYLFMAHTESHQVDGETLKRFIDWIDREGFKRSNIQTFKDLNGRPAIELFRVTPK